MDDTVRSQLIERHRETILGAIELGRAVTREWQSNRVTDSTAIRGPLERLVDASSLDQDLLCVLVDAAQTVGDQIQGRPVTAPPYLLVTSRGPVCRGTLADGRRVVLTLALFDVERNPTAYVFLDPTPEECLDITIRR